MKAKQIELVGEPVEVEDGRIVYAEDYQGQVLIYLRALNYRLKRIEEELRSEK